LTALADTVVNLPKRASSAGDAAASGGSAAGSRGIAGRLMREQAYKTMVIMAAVDIKESDFTQVRE
jgi:hypothetical protein